VGGEIFAVGNRRRYQRIAPFYDAMDLAELTFKRTLRPRVFAGLKGRILDAGVGTGRNMPFYPPGARMTGFDISAGMLSRARQRADELGVAVDLVEGDILKTGFPDAEFDAVVATFLFGTLPDKLQQPALAELARIVKPTGEIRLLDHVYSQRALWRLYMKLWLPWEKLVYNGGFDRRTESYMPAAGLELTGSELVFKDMVRLLTARPKRR
jgi:ubiquinone/menaquinone biosynthesis C-methylase UbiE